MSEETFWDTTKPVGSPDYLRLLVDSLRLCETGGDMTELADKIERDIPTRDTQVPSPIAFGHHAWATRALLEVCKSLSPEQRTSPAPGVYGSVTDTLRHLVGADRWYLIGLVDGSGLFENRPEVLVEERASVEEVMRVAESNALGWDRLIPTLDLDAEVETHRLEGGLRRASAGLRLAQALHHGSDHRGQVCTLLTTLGIEPPPISVWEYGLRQGLVGVT